jgi:DNA helicase-2/ATP-dependent DNA helicase PcrA
VAELNSLGRVIEALDAGRSFKVEAGAGSGKTHTLVSALRHLLRTRSAELKRTGQAIACITYTNAAKDEVRRRIEEDPLVHVSTIHEFLWELVQSHQAQLREALVDYNRTLKSPVDGLDSIPPDTPITYGDRGRRLAEGLISHDEVLDLSFRVISAHPRLARIIADSYPYILVDEYQDTSPRTVDVLLKHLLPGREGKIVIGLFGDSMQKIYGTGVGAVTDPALLSITKHENYRSSRAVVSLLNKIRPELPQEPAADAPDGEALVFVSGDESDPEARLKLATEQLVERGWELDATKRLYLTHRTIARTLGYPNLDKLYDSRGMNGRADLLEGREPYADLLSKIDALLLAYEAGDHMAVVDVLDAAGIKITRHSKKAEIAASLRELAQLRRMDTIGAVADLAHELQLVPKTRRVRAIEQKFGASGLDERDQRQVDFAEALRDIPFLEMSNFAKFRDELTPYSTQHGVKGSEFDDVLVVVDDTAWTQYSMGKMIAGTDKEPRVTRSRNMFYVCCSRAKRRLAVVFVSDLPSEAYPVLLDWFGTDHVFR